MSDYELTAGDEPVSVAVDQDVVHVTLGPLTVSYQTHRDQDPWDEREELLDTLRASQAAIVEAVDRHKFLHSRDQVTTVLYARHEGISISHAWNTLLPHRTEAFLRSVDEWTPYKGQCRAKAQGLLEDCLTEHGWSSRGGAVGHPPMAKARLVDLDTGELIQSFPVPVEDARHEGEWKWQDVNGFIVEPYRPGRWWRMVGSVRELPIDGWLIELEQTLGPRKQ